MDTPIFDGVLGDRLAAARESVERAERDAQRFRSALDAGREQALEQLAQSRAEALTAERTAELAARVESLERLLSRATAERDRALAALDPVETSPAASPPPADTDASTRPADEPAEPAVDSELPVDEPVEPVTPTPVDVPAARPAPAPAPTPVPVATRPPARKAADQGPTGADVPAVPSMKDIFAGTRAAGWLDSLLGSKR